MRLPRLQLPGMRKAFITAKQSSKFVAGEVQEIGAVSVAAFVLCAGVVTGRLKFSGDAFLLPATMIYHGLGKLGKLISRGGQDWGAGAVNQAVNQAVPALTASAVVASSILAQSVNNLRCWP